jgi:hypothetical protein
LLGETEERDHAATIFVNSRTLQSRPASSARELVFDLHFAQLIFGNVPTLLRLCNEGAGPVGARDLWV